MVTPIETKQVSVRYDHRRGSYENGMKASCSVQLGKWASRTSCSVQLAKWASETACLVQFSRLVGWTLVYNCPGSVVRGLEQPFLKTYLVDPFRTCSET
ncbi:hypothetical protein F2Q69_00013427 [Brassica cretica]|uniref:Uncharacterized protein n=1 Tax=Brassica cretica TaxID=69181 RepID=A0A8S9RA54_BRACR|nr:hypothetical protein F2Q69_00013427 [Brassica cretica]